MAEPRAAAQVADGNLGAYQETVRTVLTNGLITTVHPRPGMLERILPWADQLTTDLRELFGYTLIATTSQMRLIRRLDMFDPSRCKFFTTRAKKPFDRRRLAYLCLVLGAFQRSRVEISLADLVGVFGPTAESIEGLGFDPVVPGHKGAVVDVVAWLVDRGALRLSDGSLEAWARGDGGDALYDIDHDVCATIFRPARPLQHLTSATGLLDGQLGSAERRVRRMLLELPVVYYADLDPEEAAVLRREDVTANLARLTGLAVERRAEGVALADSAGRFTDRPFPGRGAVIPRAAGLLLAKIADLIEVPGSLVSVPAPSEPELQRELLGRIDSALPRAGVVDYLAWAPPAVPASARPGEVELYLLERRRLEILIDELFEQFGAGSFTGVWEQDPYGLLDTAIVLLTDLRLVRPVPGGLLLLPAAMRYRNITQALPSPPDKQLDLFGEGS
jgi:uncharacterized protein (TIGR02678 family)